MIHGRSIRWITGSTVHVTVTEADVFAKTCVKICTVCILCAVASSSFVTRRVLSEISIGSQIQVLIHKGFTCGLMRISYTQPLFRVQYNITI